MLLLLTLYLFHSKRSFPLSSKKFTTADMKEIIIFPFDLSSDFRDEDFIQGREMDLLQPGCTMGLKSFCS